MANPVPMLLCKSETTWGRSNTVQSMWGNASAMPLAIVPSHASPDTKEFTPSKMRLHLLTTNLLANMLSLARYGFIKEIVESCILASVLPNCLFMGNTKCIAIIILEPSAQAIPWFCQNWVEQQK